MRSLNRLAAVLGIVGVVLSAGGAMAVGEPGAAIITAMETALTGTAGLLVTCAAGVCALGLGIWAGPWVAKKVRGFLSKAAIFVLIGLAAGSAMAEGEPGAAIITAMETALTGTAGLLVTCAAGVCALGLGIWAGPWVAKKVRGFLSKTA